MVFIFSAARNYFLSVSALAAIPSGTLGCADFRAMHLYLCFDPFRRLAFRLCSPGGFPPSYTSLTTGRTFPRDPLRTALSPRLMCLPPPFFPGRFFCHSSADPPCPLKKNVDSLKGAFGSSLPAPLVRGWFFFIL